MRARAVLAVVAPVLCLGAVAGCSSRIKITSEPSGARVVVDGAEVGVTPLSVHVNWHTFKYNQIVLTHPECHTLATALRRKFRFPEPRKDAGATINAALLYPLYWFLVVGWHE